jgi:hypothetical protein
MDKSYLNFLKKYSGIEYDENNNTNEITRFINKLNIKSDKKKILIFASYDLPVDPFRQYIPYLCDSFDFFIVFSNSVQNSPEIKSAKDFTTIKNNYAQLKLILQQGCYDLVLISNINLFWQWRFGFVKTFTKAPILCYERDFMTTMHVRNTDEMTLLLHGKKEYAEFIMETGDYLLKNADGIVCHFSNEVINLLSEYNQNIHNYIPVWPSKFAENTTDRENEGKLVYGGSLTPDKDQSLHGTFGNLLPIFSYFTKHAEIDIFTRTDNLEVGWQKYKRCKNLRIFKNMDYDEYIKTISGNYFAGLCVMNFSRMEETSNIAYKHILVTKIFTYLASGLPVIISSEYDYAASFLMDNKLGIAYSNQDIASSDFIPDVQAISNAREHIRKFNFDAIIERQKFQFLDLFRKAALK